MDAKEVQGEDTPTESDWLFEYIDGAMKSPAWDSEVMTFIDDNCVIFDNEEENKLEYTIVHEKFADLLENLMTKHLKEVSVTPEAFADACEKARFASRSNRKVFEQLVALTDFLTFKKLMVKRNMELELEAVRELQQQSIPIVAPADEEEAEKLFQMALKESAEMSVSEAQAVLETARQEAENSKEADPDDSSKGAESDAELRKAMDLNLMELEVQNRQFEMEQQELEQAIAISLFMEQERIRLAQEEAEAAIRQAEQFAQDDDDEDSYEDVEEVVAAEVKAEEEVVRVAAKGSEENGGEKGQAKDDVDTSVNVEYSEPKVDTMSKEEGTVKPVSSFIPTSLSSAPKLTVERFPVKAEMTESVEVKKKKKDKKPKKEKTLGPITGIKSNPGLAPLPSIEELQKQMQKRKMESEEAFRRNQEALLQQKQTEKELTAAAGVTPEDAARRAAYLKEQRDKIVAKKRAERESKAKQYEEEKELEVASMMAGSGGGEVKDDESEERRNMMRIALARRMKRDLLVSESDRLRAVQEEQYSALDKQLRMVQGLRQENMIRERELGDQIKQQQEQRFRNLQNSVASQVLDSD